MKVVHILKRIEFIDQDIKDLRKLEKSIAKNKSFSTPIYMSIEKQINILLGDRIKLLELKIENPPENLVEQIEGQKSQQEKQEKTPPPQSAKKKKTKSKKVKEKQESLPAAREEFEDEEIPMMLQEHIDKKIGRLEKEKTTQLKAKKKIELTEDIEELEDIEENDENVKILDVALEKGTLNKQEIEKEKKRVKFFRDNFPTSEY